MSLTRVTPNIIAVANNVTNKTVGNTTSIPSFTFDGAGVVTSASNVAISGAGITANTVANSAFQTGSVEGYLRGANLDFGMRNRIINGAMTIDQRNNGAAITPSADSALLDRFYYEASDASKFTFQQNSGAVTPPVGFSKYLGANTATAVSISSSSYFMVEQRIEGQNIADLAWGTASAKTVTLSFWVRSSLTGTFGGAIQNPSFNRSYPFTYTIVAANTWEQKFITIPGDTSGSWPTTNALGMVIEFALGVGSTYSATAGAWAAGNYNSATGATSVVGTLGATFYITGVQFEVGSTATSFNYRPFGTELALCQRYYYTSGTLANPTNARGGYTGFAYSNGTEAYGYAKFAVSMRTAPTVTMFDNSGTSGTVTQAGQANGIAATASNINIQGFYGVEKSSGSWASTSSTYPIVGGFTASAEL